MDRDMLWRWDQVLKTHPNGMRFSVFDEQGDLLATNEYFRYSNPLSFLVHGDQLCCLHRQRRRRLRRQ